MKLMVNGLVKSQAANVSKILACMRYNDIMSFSAVIRCGDLSVSAIGSDGLTLQFSAPTMTFGTRAVYSCRSRDHRVTGNAERTCGANGNWTGEEPQCRCKHLTALVSSFTFIVYFCSVSMWCTYCEF